MFVLLAKMVGCCGISCKNCHTWCQICNNACLRRYFGNAHAKDGVLQTTNTFPIIIPHHRANFKMVCKISPPNLRNGFAKGTSNTIPNAQNPCKNLTPARQNTTQTKQGAPLAKQNTTLAPTATQNIPQSPTPRPTTLPHCCGKGVSNHLVAQLCGNARRKFWRYARQNSQHGCGI